MKHRALIGLFLAVGALLMSYAPYVRHERKRVVPVPILMYHNIDNTEDNVWFVRPEDFDKQMKFLFDSGYRTILPSDLAAHVRWGKRLPPKPLIITFDDGYVRGLRRAEPVLKQYGFHAISYIVTTWTGQSRKDQRPHPEHRDQLCIAWPEILEMRARGTFVFGSHSRTHANLAAMKDPSEEILRSFGDIAVNGGFKPDSFCYPNGQCRPDTVKVIKLSRFTTAVICDDRVAFTGPDMNLFELPRVSVCGGHQRYEVLGVSTNEANHELVVRVRNDGMKTPIWPHLSQGAQKSDEGWLEPFSLGPSPIDLRWPLAPDAADTQQRRLEFWDCNKVLLLFTRDI